MPTNVIFAPNGLRLTPNEKCFFAEVQPAGFILFVRNCETPDQVRNLTSELREVAGHADIPILIDQEGGRINRLLPPYWPARPAAARFGALYEKNPEAALEAARLNASLLATDVRDLGITVNCIPVLDVIGEGAHPVIGERAYGNEPVKVAALGAAVCDGLRDGGVSPVIKHIPGHGRAPADSHKNLPRVSVSRKELEETDFVPFKKLSNERWGMTAHVVYEALDEKPASTSPKIIAEVIRSEIGFDGLLLSDDIGMDALEGSLAERAAACLSAGCDIVLHCKGDISEMKQVVRGTSDMSGDALTRWQRAIAGDDLSNAGDVKGAEVRLDQLLSEAS